VGFVTGRSSLGGCVVLATAIFGACKAEERRAEVRITAPAPGDTVSGEVSVALTASGIEIAPASEHRPGTAHHHLFVDRDLTPAGEKMPAGTPGLVHLGKGDSTFTLEDLTPGEHRVIAVLGDSAHVPLVPLAADTVTFTVQASSACPEGEAAELVVCRFYEIVVQMQAAGLPSAEEQRVLAPYLTLELQRLMDDARAYQEAFAREHPNEKPPFVDGSLFTSLFEGLDRFEIVRAEELGSEDAEVVVRFEYRDADPWEDAVHVTREDERYVITDIVFSGAGAFNPSGRLTDRLKWRE
jgi:hypothetical protein